jgi:hypothetical protein
MADSPDIIPAPKILDLGDLGDAINEAECLSVMTGSLVQDCLGMADPSKVSGKPNCYFIPEITARAIVYGTLKLEGHLHHMDNAVSQLLEQDSAPAQTDEGAAKDHKSPIRKAWRQAFSEYACGLEFKDMFIIFDVLDLIENVLLGGANMPRSKGAAEKFFDELRVDIFDIREQIFKYAEHAAENPSDGLEQTECDAILLRSYATDPDTNAEEIAAIAARYLAQRAAKAVHS